MKSNISMDTESGVGVLGTDDDARLACDFLVSKPAKRQKRKAPSLDPDVMVTQYFRSRLQSSEQPKKGIHFITSG